MDRKPSQVLIAQLSQFAIEEGITVDDWTLVTNEYGVYDEASKVERFFQSWNWRDDDRQRRTIHFLKLLYQEDEELALSLMKRVCELAGGFDNDSFQKYPALEALEGERTDIAGGLPTLTTTTELFLDIDSTTSPFYIDLIDNINQCYQIGVYDATFVLTRKLLENQILDLLRKECAPSEIEVYFIPENGRFRGFRALLEEFEDRIDSYKPYSAGVDDKLVREIKRFKSPADAQAHTIEVSLRKEEVDELSKDAEHAVEVMFRVLKNMG